MSAVADVLNGAAALIERDGWCQGFYRRDQRRCAEAAIFSAGLDAGTEQRNAARRLLREQVRQNHIDWNDAPGRTKAEVVAALRAAAEHAS